MEVVLFDNYEAMAHILIDMAKQISISSLIICKFEDAANSIQALIEYGGLTIKSINICEDDFSGYYDEYIISVTNDMELWAEPAKRNGEYLNFGSDIYDVIFVTGDSSAKVLKDIEKDKCYETYFGELPEEYSEAEEVSGDKEESKTKDGEDFEVAIDDIFDALKNLCKIFDLF